MENNSRYRIENRNNSYHRLQYQQSHQAQHVQNFQQEPSQALKRTSIEAETPMDKLERNEIGIKSSLKGSEIKEYVDRAINKLVYSKQPRVTLKAIGKKNHKFFRITKKFLKFKILL